MATIITGIGSPEGIISAPLGNFYIDTENASVYIKMSTNESSPAGWASINQRGFIEGDLDPREGGAAAVRGTIYYNPGVNNKQLYIQMTESTSAQETGWVLLQDLSHGTVDPSGSSSTGNFYINTTYSTLYVYSNSYWNRILLLATKADTTFKNLSELLTNSVSMTNNVYDMFYNNIPMDVHMTHYDSNGELQTVNMPNRAKDTGVILGSGNPEGEVYAAMGKFYADSNEEPNTKLYLKTTTEDSNLGWVLVTAPSAYAPLVHDMNNNRYTLTTDTIPTADSINPVTSDGLHTMFATKAEKQGNKDVNFQAAFPVANDDVATKDYVDKWFSYTTFSYDASSKTLTILTPIQTPTNTEGGGGE